METIGNLWLYIAFFGIVIVMLLIDFLGFKQNKVKMSQASCLLECGVGKRCSLIWWWFMALPTTNIWVTLANQNHGILCRLLTRKVPRN